MWKREWWRHQRWTRRPQAQGECGCRDFSHRGSMGGRARGWSCSSSFTCWTYPGSRGQEKGDVSGWLGRQTGGVHLAQDESWDGLNVSKGKRAAYREWAYTASRETSGEKDYSILSHLTPSEKQKHQGKEWGTLCPLTRPWAMGKTHRCSLVGIFHSASSLKTLLSYEYFPSQESYSHCRSQRLCLEERARCVEVTQVPPVRRHRQPLITALVFPPDTPAANFSFCYWLQGLLAWFPVLPQMSEGLHGLSPFNWL